MKNFYNSKILVLFICLFILNNMLSAQEVSKYFKETSSTTWNGSTWSNGIPDKTTKVIFTSNFSTTF